MKFLSKAVVAVISLFSMAGALADEKQVKEQLSKMLPGLVIESVEESEIQGLYRVQANSSQVIFTNADASYFLAGEMFSTVGGKIVNLSEQRKNLDRAEQLASVKTSEKIVFPAKGETKAKIAVFTDIDCGYCRKLHKEVPRLNELGVEVSYLAYPRAGVGSRSYDKIVSAWCSDDPLQAMTDAKAGKSIPNKTCANPVEDQFLLGGAMGVTGTPAIVLEDGTLVPGYMPADQLAKGLGIL